MDTTPRRVLSTSDLANIARGGLMGGADIIPGVSGGTVALILGIYQRLVTAISRFDLTLLAHLQHGRWTEAARRVDLRFLVTLGSGIGIGILSLATLMHHLLTDHRQFTLGAFFGLILASTWLVAQMVERWTPVTVGCLLCGGPAAFWLVGLPFAQSPPEELWYVFLCGTVAICAMILPGISGAFILLILGKYADITGLLRSVLHAEVTATGLLTLAVFASGCLIGLLSFSKVLRWLLARCEGQTMALLCGLMAGSLRKIWPFQRDLTPQVDELKLKRYAAQWPEELDGDVLLTVSIAVVAVLFVLALDRWTTGHEQTLAADESTDEQSATS